MRARYYNPDLKRFMNRDVVSGNIIESQTLNRYAFVNGNPISYHDPFGLAREAIANSKMSLMDRLHIGLDIAGMLPVIGEVADGLNAVLYLSKGDYTNALLSGMAMIPVVGNASTVAKYADDVAFLGKKGYNEVKGTELRVRGKTSTLKQHKPKTDFYVTPSGDVVPSTGYRYMDSKYAEQTLETYKAPGSYFGFDKFETGSQARDALQISPDWSDARLRGEFDTLQVIDNMRIPLEKGGAGPRLEPITNAYPEFGSGGYRQVITNSEIKFRKVDVLGD